MAFAYTNWRGGEPNNSGGTERYAHLYGNGVPEPFWNDISLAALTNGYIIEYATTPGVPTGPEFADILYVASQSGNLVHQYRLDPTGTPVLVRTLSDGLNGPTWMALSAAKELFVVLPGGVGASNSKINRYLGAEGSPAANGIFPTTSPPLNTAHGIAFRGNELLILDSYTNQVRRFQPDASGVFSEQSPSISGGFADTLARGVGVHPFTGEVFVSHAGSNNKILRFLISSGGAVTANGEITGNGLNNPHGIAFSPWGEMFVANLGGHTISRFTLDSGGTATANGTISGNDMSEPLDVEFSPWGELFVGNHTAAKVSRFTFNGEGSAAANGVISTPGPSAGALQFVRASAPSVPAPCVPGVTSSVTDGLIGWWKGDGNASDFTGKNHGTEENGVTYEPGRFGQAFRVGYNGTSYPKVNLGFLPELKGASAYTVSMWLKVDGSHPHVQILLGLPVGNVPAPPPPPSYPGGPALSGSIIPSLGRGFYISGSSSSMTVPFGAMGSPLRYSSSTYLLNPAGGTWKHFVGVWRSSDGFHAIYEDGVLKDSGNAPAGVNFPDGIADLATGYIGGFGWVSGGSEFLQHTQVPCLFDDVRIYNRDLRQAEILLISTGEDFNTCAPPNTGIPPLAIARVPAGVKCSWPSRFTGWALESSTDLFHWEPVLGTPALEATAFSVTVPAVPSQRFFRLRLGNP